SPRPSSAVRILRLSPDVAGRLRAAPRDAARVHSVFERAINLRCHDGRLVMLQGPGALSAPFAVALERLPEARTLGPGMVATREGTQLMLASTAIDWQGAKAARTRIPPTTRVPRALGRLLDRAEPLPGAPRLDSERGLRGRECLSAGIGTADPAAFLAGARALIGLGEGLTPAGDDCVVGALAILRRWRPAFLDDRPDIRHELAAAINGGTTDVGRELLLHALDGNFSEPIVALATATSEAAASEAARRLLAIGHTSGADALLGMRLAWRAMGA
ncbi:MAG TPA: DUF2877 domain-containing protein, partial [Methylomirabilota bacterium]|nr:DUF2877 domain-containing protein [Methylomirabilota bacterium]